MNLKAKVTLAILTYNQEKYVKKAIDSALGQDYKDLLILISDDASTDQTYDLIKSTIANYSGPHEIKINRNEENLGTLAHFFRVIDLSEGTLLLLGAGDDLSKTDRVSLTVKEWQKKRFGALFSDYELIDENDNVLLSHYTPSKVSSTIEKIFGKKNAYEMHGASSAYDLNFLRQLSRPSGYYLFEDAFMTFMLHFHSKDIVKLSVPLVSYRQHDRSVSNSGRFEGSFWKIHENQYSIAKITHKRYKLSQYLFSYGNKNKSEYFNSDAYCDMANKFKVKSEWIEMTLVERFRMLFKYRNDRNFVRWLLPRTLGLRNFSLIYLIKSKAEVITKRK